MALTQLKFWLKLESNADIKYKTLMIISVFTHVLQDHTNPRMV